MTKSILLASCFAAAQAFAGPAPMSKAPAPPPPPMAPPILLSYNNISAYYEHTEIDDSKFDGLDGGGLTIEYSPLQHLYFTASGSLASGDHECYGDVDVWGVSAGVGGYVTLTPGIDFAVDAGGLWAGVELDDGEDADNDGFYIRPHIRAKFNIFEIHVGARYTDADERESDWQGFTNLYFEVAPQWDLLAGVTFDDEDYTLRGGVRFKF